LDFYHGINVFKLVKQDMTQLINFMIKQNEFIQQFNLNFNDYELHLIELKLMF